MSSDLESTIPWQVSKAAEEYGALLNPVALRLTLNLYRTMADFDRASTMELAPYGMTVSQFNILTVLHRATSPLTMGELSEAVSVRPANLTSVIDTMVKRSLVERRTNPSDRRSYLVTKTAKAEDFLVEFLPSHWKYLESLTAELCNEECDRLSDLLHRLDQSVKSVLEGNVRHAS